MKFNLPDAVKILLRKLHNSGYEAYIVGGCVRDLLMGVEPQDWDICTSAKPEEVQEIFQNWEVIPTGLKHGTVTVVFNQVPYEITTFRVDGEYSDNRRPDNVSFTTSLEEDLSRRDFTINAMAYNDDVGIIDIFGGQSDLQQRLIKCVGVPQDRFQEDSLRILRALRFSTRFGFTVEAPTSYAMRRCAHLLSNISKERITSELNKILMCNDFYLYHNLLEFSDIITAIVPELASCVGFNQNNPYHCYDVYQHSVFATSVSNGDLITKLALLFHDIAKPSCMTTDDTGISHYYGHGHIGSDMVDDVMKRMRFDNDTRSKVVELIRLHDSLIEPSSKSIRRWLSRIGEEQLRRLLNMRYCDIYAQNMKTNFEERINKVNNIWEKLEEILAENECFRLKDLDICGYDLINIGYKEGKQIGVILNDCLNGVIEGVLNNNKACLIDYIRTKY